MGTLMRISGEGTEVPEFCNLTAYWNLFPSGVNDSVTTV